MPSIFEQRAQEMRSHASFDFSRRFAHILYSDVTREEKSQKRAKQPSIAGGFRFRILTGFSLIILLTVVISLWSHYTISVLGSATENLFTANYRSIEYAHTMERAVRSMVDPAASGASVLLQDDSLFRTALHAEMNNLTEPGELELARRIESEYRPFYTAVSSSPLDTRYRQIIVRQKEALLRSVAELHVMNERAMFARSDSARSLASVARISSIGISGALILLACILAVAVSRRSLAEFRDLDRAKSNFVSTAAHQLKNPLTSIRTSSRLLLDGIVGKLSSEQREVVEGVRQESESLLRLVWDLLDLARLEAGGLTLKKSSVDVETVVDSAVLPVSLLAHSSNVDIDVLLPTPPVDLYIDPNKFSWALSNVLSNAVRYSPRNSHVEVRASVVDSEVWISVRDHGKGIQEADLKRIFEKFEQVESSVFGGGSGSGLGLAIAREIVTAHGGRVWAESSPGDGAVFTIAIPNSQAH